MRIRSTKPEFWRSERIAGCSWDARLVLKALESFVDDNGVGEDSVNTLVGDCFLHDLIREGSRALARVSEAISELERAGLVWRYEANGRNLLFVSFWESVQRIDKPQPGRNPRPDGTMNYKDSVILESFAKPRESSRSLAPGTGEQGNRGTEEQRNRNTSSPAASEIAEAFNLAYSHWPKKVERKTAETRFKAAVKKRDMDALVADIIRFGDAYAATTERKFTPALGAWISGERWTDDLPTSGPNRPSRTSNELEAFALLGGGDSERTRDSRALDPGQPG